MRITDLGGLMIGLKPLIMIVVIVHICVIGLVGPTLISQIS